MAIKTILFIRLPVWRTVIAASFVLGGFYLFWIIPVLDEMEEMVYSHQLETAEKIEIELEEVIIKRPENLVDELAFFVSPKLKSNGVESVEAIDFSGFFENRSDVREIFIADLLGAEKARVARDRVFVAGELRDFSKDEHFVEAARDGFAVRPVYRSDGTPPDMLAMKRFDALELGGFVLAAEIDISGELENFSAEIKEDENERVFIVDDRGTIIDHYIPSAVGHSLSNNDLIKSVLGADNPAEGKYFYRYGVYQNFLGEKLQAVALLFRPVNFVVVVEENFRSVWGPWNKFLLSSVIGVGSVILLIVFLTRNTLKMFDVSSQLAKERDRVESIIAHLEVGIIEYDDNFTVVLINPKAEKLLNIKKEEVLNQTVDSEFLKYHPNAQTLAQVLYPTLSPNAKKVPVREGSVPMIEMKFEGPTDLYLQVTTIRIFHEPTKTYRFLKVLRDVSREEAIARSKSEFISVAAHQLRTPLSAIKWVFKMMLEGDAGAITPEQREYLQKGYDSNERIIELVGDMLDVSRIEEGRFGFEFYYVDITDVIQKAIETFGVKAKEKNIKLVFEKSERPLNPIKVDPARMGLVFQNLIDNALKYTPDGGIVSIKVTREDEFIQISVSDTGIGVSRDQFDKLFTKFFRGTNAVRSETDGTGLGLFIVRNIVRRHGGDVWAKSEEGKGSTFYVALPLKEEMAEAKENGAVKEFVEGLSTQQADL